MTKLNRNSISGLVKTAIWLAASAVSFYIGVFLPSFGSGMEPKSKGIILPLILAGGLFAFVAGNEFYWYRKERKEKKK